MNKSLVAAAPTARRRTAPCLAGRPALYLLASVIVSLLAASSASTPLYAIYRARWGFTPITATVVFGVYAIAVLFAPLVLGRLSDHTGRRPVLLVALTAQVVSLVVLTTANGVPVSMGGPRGHRRRRQAADHARGVPRRVLHLLAVQP